LRVAGGLSKKLDVVATMKAAGFTPRQIKRLALRGSLTEAEFETALERAAAVAPGATDRVMDREVRRVLRQRSN